MSGALNEETLNGLYCLNGPNTYSESAFTDDVIFYQNVGVSSTISDDVIFRQVVVFGSVSTVTDDVIFRQNVVCTGPSDYQIVFRQRVY